MGEYVISSLAINRNGRCSNKARARQQFRPFPRLCGKTAFYFLVRFDLVFVVCRYAASILLHSFSERRYTSVQRLHVGLPWPGLSLPLLANGGYLCWSHAH